MKTLKQIIAAIAFILAFASCQREEMPAEGGEMAFSVSVAQMAGEGAATKATLYNSFTDIQDETIYVSAYKHSDNEEVFASQPVTYSSTTSKWTLTNEQIWKENVAYDFFATANIPASGATKTVSGSAGITYTVSDITAAQSDALLGLALSQNKANSIDTGTVALAFSHPYASVVVKAGSLSGNITSISLKGVYASGKTSLSAVTDTDSDSVQDYSWTNLGNPNATLSRTGISIAPGSSADAFVVIPQDLSSDSVILTITTSDNKSYSKVISTGEWKAGYTTTYTLSDANGKLLSGDFSVSAYKKVKFTSGNLYWNGRAFKLESSQTAYPTSWDANHVGHFFWTKTAAASYASSYDDGTCATTDKFFADGSFAAYRLNIGSLSDLYVLSSAEWDYLISSRTNASSLYKSSVTVNGVTGCLVIAPDDYDYTTTPLLSSYTESEWATAEEAGLVCLPPAGYRESSTFEYQDNSWVLYWSATPDASDAARACYLHFLNGIYNNTATSPREHGFPIRLVCTSEDTTRGTAAATIGGSSIDVEWVQLWSGGPKWATINVGQTLMDYSLTLYTTSSDMSDVPSPYYTENVGGLYCWGDTENKRVSRNTSTYSSSTSNIQGTGEDTAKSIWGSNWQMPTESQLNDLISTSNCTITHSFSLQGSGLVGILITGKGNYASNCIFLPDAGKFDSTLQSTGGFGSYWSATYYKAGNPQASYLNFSSTYTTVKGNNKYCGYSVRAILAE